VVDLNDVLIFVRIIEGGSIAGAARRLGMPANSVSRRLQALESELGVQLMQRSTRKLTLTDAGARLYRESAERLTEVAQYARDLRDEEKQVGGVVRVAAAADLFDAFSMDWVSEFLAAHPRASLEFVLDDHRIDLIEHGIDLALRAGGNLEDNLVAKRVGRTRNCLVASPAFLDRRDIEAVTDLAPQDCLPMLGSTPQGVWRLEGPDGSIELAPRARFSANTVRSLLSAAVAGLGIALLPSTIARRALSEGRLRHVLPSYSGPIVEAHFVRHEGMKPSSAAIAFQAFASEKMLSNGILES